MDCAGLSRTLTAIVRGHIATAPSAIERASQADAFVHLVENFGNLLRAPGRSSASSFGSHDHLTVALVPPGVRKMSRRSSPARSVGLPTASDRQCYCGRPGGGGLPELMMCGTTMMYRFVASLL